jgi:hypothetical protein
LKGLGFKPIEGELYNKGMSMKTKNDIKLNKFIYARRHPNQFFYTKNVPHPTFTTLPKYTGGISNYKGPFISNTTKLKNIGPYTVHELTHNKFLNRFINTAEHHNPIIAPDNLTISELAKFEKDARYIADNSEVYSRLNEIRYNEGIEPGHFVTTPEALSIYKKEDFTG